MSYDFPRNSIPTKTSAFVMLERLAIQTFHSLLRNVKVLSTTTPSTARRARLRRMHWHKIGDTFAWIRQVQYHKTMLLRCYMSTIINSICKNWVRELNGFSGIIVLPTLLTMLHHSSLALLPLRFENGVLGGSVSTMQIITRTNIFLMQADGQLKHVRSPSMQQSLSTFALLAACIQK